MAVYFFFRRTFLLQPLHQVSVPHELEVLPGREEQHHHEHGADGDRSPQLTLARLVDLTDDWIVANVLLDRVLEIGRAHASLSIARSLALRALGLRSRSSSPASTGRF